MSLELELLDTLLEVLSKTKDYWDAGGNHLMVMSDGQVYKVIFDNVSKHYKTKSKSSKLINYCHHAYYSR